MEQAQTQTHNGDTHNQARSPAQQPRALSPTEIRQVQAIRDKSAEFLTLLAEHGGSREISLARTKVDEASMWAIKHITRE